MSIGKNGNGTDIVKVRIKYGIDIILYMRRKGMFPLANLNKLATEMQYCFKNMFAEEEEELGHTWQPTVTYWCRKLQEIRDGLEKLGHFLKYVRARGSFHGRWMFVSRKEYRNAQLREALENNTRIEHYNRSLDNANKKWPGGANGKGGVGLPKIENMPLLPEYVEV